MQKFQAKYEIECDLEATKRSASNSKFSSVFKGGRPSKNGESTGAQLIIKLERLDATILVSPKRVQTYWPGHYQKINEIENILEGILEPKPAVSLSSLRTSVPSIIEEQTRTAIMTEKAELLEMLSKKAVQIKELETLLDVSKRKIQAFDEAYPELVPLACSLIQKQKDSEIDRIKVIERNKKLLSSV
jgi:hypothetical protein